MATDDTGKYVHLMMLAVLGKTAQHLRDGHDIVPSDNKRTNAAVHLSTHGVPVNARWSWRSRQFVTPKED